MDWSTVAIAVPAAAAAAGVVGVVLRVTVERAIDARFKILEEQNRAKIQEETRRQSRLYDRQFDALKAALTITYRLRNTLREVTTDAPPEMNRVKELMSRVRTLHDALSELLFEERAILPEGLFVHLHELRHEFDSLSRYQLQTPRLAAKTKDDWARVRSKYQIIDKLYLELASSVRIAIGADIPDG